MLLLRRDGSIMLSLSNSSVVRRNRNSYCHMAGSRIPLARPPLVRCILCASESEHLPPLTELGRFIVSGGSFMSLSNCHISHRDWSRVVLGIFATFSFDFISIFDSDGLVEHFRPSRLDCTGSTDNVYGIRRVIISLSSQPHGFRELLRGFRRFRRLIYTPVFKPTRCER